MVELSSQQLRYARVGREALLGGRARQMPTRGGMCSSSGIRQRARGADRKRWPRQDRTQRKRKLLGCRAGQGAVKVRFRVDLLSDLQQARHAVSGPRVLLPVGGPNRNCNYHPSKGTLAS